jgi:hypothetical protein
MPDAGRYVTSTPTFTVESCTWCPFQDSGDGRPNCNADPEYRLTEPNYGETHATGRPDWCPLDKGPVLVQVRK